MTIHESSAADQTCAFAACSCPVEPGKGVVKDGKNYCCQGCVDGVGCSNPQCNCGKN